MLVLEAEFFPRRLFCIIEKWQPFWLCVRVEMVFAGRYEAMRCPLPLSINSCLSWVPGSFALEMCVSCASHVDPALLTYLASSIPDMRGKETVSRPLPISPA